MSKPISYATAAHFVEEYAEGEQGSLRSALLVLAAGLRWKEQYDGDEEEPSLIADVYALVFPMHKGVFRELAATMRSMRNNL